MNETQFSPAYLEWISKTERADKGQEEYSRPGWDEYFLDICTAVSARADCRRKKVGALIVSPDHHIISAGYNGAPPGDPGCLEGACPRGLKTYQEIPEGGSYNSGPDTICISIHAEANAIIRAGTMSKGATIYSTHKPCYGCYKLIASAGIIRISYLK